MYCPDCATLNDTQTRYCRKCGRPLTGVQLALDGRVEDAIAKFKKSEDLLGLGLLIFAMFMVSGLFMLFWAGGPRPFSFVVLLALIVCLPIVLTGLIKVDRVRRLLEADADKKQIEPQHQGVNALPARTTDPLEMTPEFRGSVTDRTTLHLDEHKPSTNA
jgi:hypothetical protein